MIDDCKNILFSTIETLFHMSRKFETKYFIDCLCDADFRELLKRTDYKRYEKISSLSLDDAMKYGY